MKKVLFVCMGNICRSPTAEGVFRNLVEKQGLLNQFVIDSSGTHAYHEDEPPDPRARKTALERGIDISMQRARRFRFADFENFDHILVMDEQNYKVLMDECPTVFAYKVKYFLDFAPHLNAKNVPDPYYGGTYGFQRVLDMVEDAAHGLLEELRETEESGVS